MLKYLKARKRQREWDGMPDWLQKHMVESGFCNPDGTEIHAEQHKGEHGRGCKKCNYDPQVLAEFAPGMFDYFVCEHCCADLGSKREKQPKARRIISVPL